MSPDARRSDSGMTSPVDVGGVDRPRRVEAFHGSCTLNGPGIFEVSTNVIALTPVSGAVLLWGPNMAFTLQRDSTYVVGGSGGYKVVLADQSLISFRFDVAKEGAEPFKKASIDEIAAREVGVVAGGVSAELAEAAKVEGV